VFSRAEGIQRFGRLPDGGRRSEEMGMAAGGHPRVAH